MAPMAMATWTSRTRRRRDGHEAGHDARRHTQVGEVAVAQPLDERPAEPPAAAAARKVFMNAWTAWPLAASAEPALKPNQPNHKMPVPSMTSGMEWGG
jgi:hypothetical protein